jgi:hypothetical protein
MVDATPFLPGLSPVQGKAVIARFDGGRLSSEGGLLALREIERRLAIADRLAACLKDPRMPEKVVHRLAEIIRFRMLMIAAGYEDGNDADTLRCDPMFKLALDRLPSGEAALLSPTSKAAAPSTFTSGSTAPAAKPRTTSRRGRTTSPPIAPPATRPRPTSFACSCTLAPIGSCGRCAASCPNVRLGELCSLIPCGCAWSKLLPVSSSSKPSSKSTCRRAPPIRRSLPCSSAACRG